ncbi:MAG: hypothetical protein D8M61_10945 [Ignavibacteriae bacterium]|nr:hypothetical protein [Ignavibacteriota bacterium]
MNLKLASVYSEQNHTDNLFAPINNFTPLHPKLQTTLMTFFDISLLNDDNLSPLSASFKVEAKINFKRG